MWLSRSAPALPTAETALPGRSDVMPISDVHRVLGHSLVAPFPDGMEIAVFAMGCFWGAERIFWQVPGVWSTAVGYSGGFTPNPTYEEVCSGRTGHAEAVLVVFDPTRVSFEALVKVFWEAHDPTQGMGQGNDIGTQYRSAIYTEGIDQLQLANALRDVFADRLVEAGLGPITSEIEPLGTFYYAEEYHQQYLDRNPNGYCGLGSTGVTCPVGIAP